MAWGTLDWQPSQGNLVLIFGDKMASSITCEGRVEESEWGHATKSLFCDSLRVAKTTLAPGTGSVTLGAILGVICHCRQHPAQGAVLIFPLWSQCMLAALPLGEEWLEGVDKSRQK